MKVSHICIVLIVQFPVRISTACYSILFICFEENPEIGLFVRFVESIENTEIGSALSSDPDGLVVRVVRNPPISSTIFIISF